MNRLVSAFAVVVASPRTGSNEIKGISSDVRDWDLSSSPRVRCVVCTEAIFDIGNSLGQPVLEFRVQRQEPHWELLPSP